MKFGYVLYMGLLASQLAFAGYKGEISFDPEEIAGHAKDVAQITETASQCLKADLDRHNEFFKRYGISAFYGSLSGFNKLSLKAKRGYLESLHKDPDLVSELQPTSCVGLTVKCLEKGFKAVGEDEIWEKLKAYTSANDMDGGALQFGLQKLGWKVLYWNPDVNQNAAFDAMERQNHPNNHDHYWGDHAANWRSVQTRHIYYLNPVDDFKTLINFGEKQPDAIKKIPFFVGTAHSGYHVFPGTYGQVIEGHSMRKINDPKTVETAPFSPIHQAPTDGEYRSGIIAVPPGY